MDALAVGVQPRDRYFSTQGDILTSKVEDLELVDARLGGRGVDGEANELRVNRGEVFFVGELRHGDAEVW